MTPEAPLCDDLAAYALGALAPSEADMFERHLRSCATCPAELAAFQHVVDELSSTPTRLPAPASLRRSVMRTVVDEPRRDPAGRRERRRARGWLSLPRPALALATGLAVVVVAAAVLVAAFALPGSPGPKNRTVAAQVTGRGTAALQISDERGHLVVHHFPPPPRGKIYEVWLLKRGAKAPSPTSALFSVTADGDGDVGVPGSLKDVSQVMVTPEPAGGSQTPTHPAVISATLS